MGAFGTGKKVPKGDPGKRGFGTKMAKYLSDKALRCVSERQDSIETVLSHGGILKRKGKELHIYGEHDELLFSCTAEEMNAGELMSLEGVVITARDNCTGEIRTMIAYYKYWRPLN
ncbi:MAG: hypothetical protein J6L96_00010 [Clostridia bacterium]|nr:hypothetical protein [Clostridia bacterium]